MNNQIKLNVLLLGDKIYSVECLNVHDYMTFTNMLSEPRYDEIIQHVYVIARAMGSSFMLSHSGAPCHQHLDAIVCKTFFPICDPVRKSIIPFCKEIHVLRDGRRAGQLLKQVYLKIIILIK